MYVEIPKPSRVELKCSQILLLATPERILVSQHRPDAEGLISILKCLKANSFMFYHYPGGSWLSYLRKRLMHFPFEIIIWDTKVF
jgi:hypothetical protein